MYMHVCTSICSTCTMYIVYMLGTDLKPAARFKAVWTVLKPSGWVKNGPDGFKAVGAKKCGYKAVQQAGC